MNVLITNCTMNFAYLILIIAFVWFMFPFIKCVFNSKCRNEHLKPLMKVMTNFSGKPKE